MNGTSSTSANDDSRKGSTRPTPMRARLLIGLSVITCPCHLPVLAVMLAGTAAGVFLQAYLVPALVIFSLLFLLSIRGVYRSFADEEPSCLHNRGGMQD